MEGSSVPMLLVSANVGSLFEFPDDLFSTWIKEFLRVIKHFQPKFIALHCQEVGGKFAKDSKKLVDDFIRFLTTSEELTNHSHRRIYVDEDFTNNKNYTALGNFYFIHKSLKDIRLWNFRDKCFHPLNGEEIYSGNIDLIETIEKAKFPLDINPESSFSRKGFMRTRWNVGQAIFDLVNVHMFHDASNFVAMEEFPSKYSKLRKNALLYILERFSADSYAKVPFFIFGDFNFRLDTKGVIQKLTSQTVPVYVTNSQNGEIEKILYKDPDNESKVILTLEKKVFDFHKHEESFFKNEKWLQEYDKELKFHSRDLFEFDVSFPPSYPFEEDTCGAKSYMRTRCPSWCDRILLSQSAVPLVSLAPTEGTDYPAVVYQLIGENAAMGDHKPVMLMFNLVPYSGHEGDLKSELGK